VDIVTPKPDPFNMIASDYGQPAGNFNWNADQFELMNRPRRTCDGCTEGGKHVVVQDLTIFVNDSEYFIKAVCYVPVPLGTATEGGLCSIRRDPYGQNNSACTGDFYYSDDSPGRIPPGPTGGWFTNLWHRDFPILKQAGANAIRLYYASPITKLYTEHVLNNVTSAIPGDGTIVPPAYGYTHTTFLDMAYAYGLMVIYPLYGDQTGVTIYPAEQIEAYIMNQIDEVGNHPAILMFSVGNEWPIASDASLLAKLNHFIAFARNYTMTKWGRKIPVTHALNDDPFAYNEIYAGLDVDVMSTNAGYRGEGFQDLWSGDQTPGFSGLGNLSRQYSIPNFISEMGWIQINGTQTASLPGWFNLKWQSLIQQGTLAGCVGGAFFEYLNEIYTKADPAQQTMGMVAPSVSTATNMLPTTFPTIAVTYPPYYQSTSSAQADDPAHNVNSENSTSATLEATSDSSDIEETSASSNVGRLPTVIPPSLQELSDTTTIQVTWFAMLTLMITLFVM
jgi:hypothetical protein